MPQQRHAEPDHQQRAAVVAADVHRIQRRQHQAGFASGALGRLGRPPAAAQRRAPASTISRAATAAAILIHPLNDAIITDYSSRLSAPECRSRGRRCPLSRMRSGSDIPPVRKMRIPSSTVDVGKEHAAPRIHHHVAEVQMVRRHVHRHQRLRSLTPIDRELLREKPHHDARDGSPPPSRRA